MRAQVQVAVSLLASLLSISSFGGIALPKSAPLWGYGFTNAFPGIQFNHPVAIASPRGETNRLFVVKKTGRIIVIPDLRPPSPAVFLDLTNSTFASVEGGMLGLAFHPGYSTNGR